MHLIVAFSVPVKYRVSRSCQGKKACYSTKNRSSFYQLTYKRVKPIRTASAVRAGVSFKGAGSRPRTNFCLVAKDSYL